MNYSTALWISGVLGTISIVTITVYFILDANEIMISFLYKNIELILTLTMPPVIFLLAAILMAKNKQEERSTRQAIKRAVALISALLLYKIMTG
ncbi:hypothetical protein [Oceanobacillus sp. FSL H7-0719]|uniref:hypothetical protein n=1 Tax=Oceanobacillus sp. FSL H7-0719 TaxID=2954507 RepID=UPI00324F9478